MPPFEKDFGRPDQNRCPQQKEHVTRPCDNVLIKLLCTTAFISLCSQVVPKIRRGLCHLCRTFLSEIIFYIFIYFLFYISRSTQKAGGAYTTNLSALDQVDC
jgi:hypothetical protein